jgi:hypothetical protein
MLASSWLGVILPLLASGALSLLVWQHTGPTTSGPAQGQVASSPAAIPAGCAPMVLA